jgi:hypothetical protein
MHFVCLSNISGQKLMQKVNAFMLGRETDQGEVIVPNRVEANNHPHNRRLMDASGRVIPSGAVVAKRARSSGGGAWGQSRFEVQIQLKQRVWSAGAASGVSPFVAELESLRGLWKSCRPSTFAKMVPMLHVRGWLLKEEWTSDEVWPMLLRSHAQTAKAVRVMIDEARAFTRQSGASFPPLVSAIPSRVHASMTVVMGWLVEPTARCWKHFRRLGHQPAYTVPQPDMVTILEAALAQAGAVALPAIGFDSGLTDRIRITGRGRAGVAGVQEHPMGVSLTVSFSGTMGVMQTLRAAFEPEARQAELWLAFDSACTSLPYMQCLLVSLAATFVGPALQWRTRDRGSAPMLGVGSRRGLRAPDLFAAPDRA